MPSSYRTITNTECYITGSTGIVTTTSLYPAEIDDHVVVNTFPNVTTDNICAVSIDTASHDFERLANSVDKLSKDLQDLKDRVDQNVGQEARESLFEYFYGSDEG